jgi:hypothetical protein
MTAEGQAAFAAIAKAVTGYTERFLEPLSQAERANLVSVLVKLYAATPEGRRMPPRLAPAGRAAS